MSRLHNTSSTPVNQYSKLKSFFAKPKCIDTISTTSLPKRGDIIQLDGLGGSCELTGGTRATLQNLVDISVGGVILFTYPKTNTPGCKSDNHRPQHPSQHLIRSPATIPLHRMLLGFACSSTMAISYTYSERLTENDRHCSSMSVQR